MTWTFYEHGPSCELGENGPCEDCMRAYGVRDNDGRIVAPAPRPDDPAYLAHVASHERARRAQDEKE